jgi:hypothetical protein
MPAGWRFLVIVFPLDLLADWLAKESGVETILCYCISDFILYHLPFLHIISAII